jgi:hypothetical protein
LEGRLGFAERAIVKVVRALYGDYRNWPEITAWAREIAGSVAASGTPSLKAWRTAPVARRTTSRCRCSVASSAAAANYQN